MSDLIVLDFDGTGTADEVLTRLRSMQKEHLIDLEDACVVVHTDAGKVQVKQAVNLTKAGAATGLSTGMLIGALAGLLVLNPLAGMVVGGLSGAGFGALSGKMADYGINDDFIKGLGNTIPEGLVGPVHSGQELHTRQGPARDRALQAARAQDIALQAAGGQAARRVADESPGRVGERRAEQSYSLCSRASGQSEIVHREPPE